MRSKGLWSETLHKLSIPDDSKTPDYAGSGPSSHWKHDPVPRRMHDSYCEIRLPFASSPVLLENYTNASGGIRTGLLMEHLDSLAGSIGYKHMLGPEAKELPHNVDFYIVTASVERYVCLVSCWLRSCSR